MRFCLLNILVAFVILSGTTYTHAKKVLVISSYHSTYAWQKRYISGLKQELGEVYRIHLFYMDTARINKGLYEKRANLAWEKYQKIKPDIVVLGDDNALRYMGARLGETQTPVVFLGINGNPRHYFKDKKIPVNITGILERPRIAENMRMIKRLLPKLKSILIVFDSGHTSKAIMGGFAREISSIDKKGLNLEYDIKFIQKQEEWIKTIKTAKARGYGAIFLGSYHSVTDKRGRHISGQKLISWTNANSELPVLGFWSAAIGKGKALGGIVLDGKKHGIEAGRMMKDVLAGKKSTINPGAFGVYLFSRSELKRWKIKLPKVLENKAVFVE